MRNSRARTLVCLLAGAVLLAAGAIASGPMVAGPPAGGAAAATPVAPWPTAGWTRAEPATVGLDPSPIATLVERIRAGEDDSEIHGLLIVKDGYLVVEEYFGGWHADALHTTQSVTKSVISALVGIAIDQTALAGASEPVLRFFPGYRPKRLDPRRRLTLAHLLTMRGGSDFHEEGPRSPLSRMNRLRRGWISFILDAPMVAEPGTVFRYDSGGVILLGEMLRARTGLAADAFAERYLFAPLGIERYAWARAEDGVVHTGGGLDLRPRDLARLGLLYLRGGRWEDRPIVSPGWIERSLERHVPAARWLAGREAGYGYLWWVLPADERSGGEIFAAIGHMGQYLFVVPGHDLVVVVTAGARDRRAEERPIDWLYQVVLPALGECPPLQKKIAETCS